MLKSTGILRGQVRRAGRGCLLGHVPVLIILVNLFTRASGEEV
jgi:hypothetical protein